MRWCCLAISIVVAAALGAQTPAPMPAPVLVELFTSEGCSDCPPADRLLARLDGHAIVLSEHVDYWNSLGWKDPFSAALFSRRQETYCSELGAQQGPYTPQMVVDGEAQFVGSDAGRAADEIAKAARRPKADVKLTRTAAGLQVEIASAPASGDVWMVLADNRDESQVAAGENKGRRLEHIAVVRSLQKIGTVKRGGAFSHLAELPASAATQRVVVFVQQPGQGRVTGAAMWRADASPSGSQ
ncbi:MAG TPA: DUF1223 domain-containing protein [Bryobacteraceae bacterium]|nr:DUF1223 domain-containing protein [Bryobacteraceae bacterium]